MAVRKERVIVEAVDRFSQPVARMAAAAHLLSGELDNVNNNASGISRRLNTVTRSTDRMHTSMQTLQTDLGNVNRGLTDLNGARGVGRLNTNLRQTNNQLDSTSGRVGLLAEALITLGPAVAPIGAVAVPAITGLATQLGFAGLAAGTAVLAFQGVGDALKAVNTAALEPTQENLNKARDAMAQITPAARGFVNTLRDMAPLGDALQRTAARGLLPGLSDSLRELTTLGPRVNDIIGTISTTLGDMARKGAENLTGNDWRRFVKYLQSDARPTLEALGSVVGDVAHGLATMLVSFAPANRDFTNWLVDVADGFDRWARGLKSSQDFAAFLDYIQTSGPQVAATAGAIVNAMASILTAAAPLGGPVLKAIEAVANALASIADSPIGTPIFAAAAALLAFNRAATLTAALTRGGLFSRVAPQLAATATSARTAGTSMRVLAGDVRLLATASRGGVTNLGSLATSAGRVQQAVGKFKSGAGKGALAAGALALATTDLGDSVTGSTASMAAMGGLMGGPWGAAIGAGIGLTTGLAHANDDLKASIEAAQNSLDAGRFEDAAKQTKAFTESTQKAMNESRPSFSLDVKDTFQNFKALEYGIKDVFGGGATAASKAAGKINASMADAGRGTSGLTAAMVHAKVATDGWSASMAHLNDVLTGRADMRTFKQSIDDASDALKENGRTLNNNGDKGRQNAAALDAIAASANKVADGMSQANRVPFLRNARQQLVSAAQSFGMTRKAARDYAAQVLAIPKTAKTKVDADTLMVERKTKAAQSGLDKLDRTHPNPRATLDDRVSGPAHAAQRAIDGIHGKEVVITTIMRVVNQNVAAHNAGLHPDQRAAGGRMVGPGTGTSDSIPALLSNGEWVIRAAAVAQYGDGLLSDINSMRFASGGSVDRRRNTGGRESRIDKRFDLSGTADVRSELQDFARAIKGANLHVGRNFGALSKQALGLSKAYADGQTRLETLQARASDARSAAAGSFNHDVTGGSRADLRLGLSADRNDANSITRALAAASKNGLDGALAQAISASGNVALAQEYAHATKAQIASDEKLYAQRAGAQTALGQAAVQVSGLATAITAQQAELKGIAKSMDNLERKIENGVYRGAKAGIDGRKKDSDRRIAAGTRTGR